MKKIKKYVQFMACIVLFTLLVGMNLYGLVNCNGAGQGYEGPGRSLTTENSAIDGYIIDAAGFYFAAKSDIEGFLRSIELQDSQGLDYKGLNILLARAMANMKAAIAAYEALIREAENTPYNDDVQVKLKTFDYVGFMSFFRLNPFIFEEAAICLKKGDITGVFKKNHSRLVHILELLQVIYGQTSLDKLPGLSIIWQLNEECCEASMFGSYVVRIFTAIR
ncbi:MAG: hypothetical protein NT166_32545 [Candidatus Aminicenantes bacterium]|nr:hypothetical protein [Candidatus Aminicenantes bacterium]